MATQHTIQSSLTNWFIANGGSFNPSLELTSDEKSGQHFRATTDISTPLSPAGQNTFLCYCPFSLSLSYLNVLESPPEGVRKHNADSVCSKLYGKIPNAAVSYFFLCEQKLKGEHSFWAPYIDALPTSEEMSTPWWFDENDLKWLLGTNIHASSEPERSGLETRRAMWKDQWKQGLLVLQFLDQAEELSKYTWELFLWAATIFSSRSFTSRIFASSSSSSSSSSNAAGQEVGMEEEESFALLYPFLDSFNHKFGAKVIWSPKDGNFELSTTESVGAGEEVFNNYAPKGNEELLNGYGFCVPDNPCDEVTLQIGKPPEAVLATLREKLPQRFPSTTWTNECATFFIRGSKHYSGGYTWPASQSQLRGIPPDLFTTIHEILDFSYKAQGEALEAEHLDPATADALLERLMAKLNAIREWDEDLDIEQPKNKRAEAAKIYRDGQVAILEEVIGELDEWLCQF